MFRVNNIEWDIERVARIRRSDGTYTLGVTDNTTKKIYLLSSLHGYMLNKVLCHELTHVICFSYGIYMDIDTEEMIADFIATYGREIFDILDDLSLLLIGRNTG